MAAAEQHLNEERHPHQQPGPAMAHPAQQPGGTAGGFRQQGDVQSLGQQGGEAAVEAQGVGELLQRAERGAGPARVQAAAQALQQQPEQAQHAPGTAGLLHQRGVQVFEEQQGCHTAQGCREGRQGQQGHGQGLVPEEEALGARVALSAAGWSPLVLGARGAAGAVCKESLVSTP